MGRRTGGSHTTARQPLTLRVLGSVSVERGGERLDLPPSKKTRALLGYLLIEGREQTREHLCSLFWDLPDDPRGALRWSLSRLRPLLDEQGGQRIVADRERVRIDPGTAVVDLRAAEALEAKGLDRASIADLREAAASSAASCSRGSSCATPTASRPGAPRGARTRASCTPRSSARWSRSSPAIPRRRCKRRASSSSSSRPTRPRTGG